MNKLKEVRFFKRVSPPPLALKTGIQQSRISLIENELVTPKDVEKSRITNALGVNVQEIFTTEADNDNGR